MSYLEVDVCQIQAESTLWLKNTFSAYNCDKTLLRGHQIKIKTKYHILLVCSDQVWATTKGFFTYCNPPKLHQSQARLT